MSDTKSTDDSAEFQTRNDKMIQQMGSHQELNRLTNEWLGLAQELEYSYHFTWMGRPIIQYPQDMVAMQELIWQIKPDLVIETGIARGGSLIYYASLLELIGSGEVLGIDVDIRPHNRAEIEKHPMSKRISMLQGSSLSEEIADQVRDRAQGKDRVIVCLDSMHSHDHVLKELELYSPLVTSGSYLVVFDTVIENLPSKLWANRPWDKGDNARTAVDVFLKTHPEFEVDQALESKLQITVAPGGYLRKK